MKMKIFLLFLVLITCAGCGPKYSVLVDAINSQEFESSTDKTGSYIILSRDEKDKNNLYYQEFYAHVKNIFERNGNIVVDNPSHAKYIAFINFNTSDPHEYTVTESLPVYGQTGVNTHTTSSYGPYGYVSHNTYTTPQYGIVGYNTYQRKEILYAHCISVSAYEFTPLEKEALGKKVWQLIAVDSNESGDFRNTMTQLLFILEKYMTKNTRGSANIEIYEKDGKLVLKEEMSTQKKID